MKRKAIISCGNTKKQCCKLDEEIGEVGEKCCPQDNGILFHMQMQCRQYSLILLNSYNKIIYFYMYFIFLFVCVNVYVLVIRAFGSDLSTPAHPQMKTNCVLLCQAK